MTRHRILLLIAMAAVLCTAGTQIEAAEWGNLKGRFVLDGTAPEMDALKITKDVEFCSKHHPVDQSFVVGDGGAIQGAILYIRPPRGKKVDVHPDYEDSLKEPVVLDNKGCIFVSHVTLARVGQPLIIKNSDPIGHNTNAALQANGSFNTIIAANTEREMKFSKAERLPMPVACNIHPWMSGYLLIRDDPYMASSADDGSFEITNIPAGEHEFQFWHEKIGYLKDCKYDGGKLDRRGRNDLKITAGETLDLGDIVVPASLIK